MMDFLRRFMYGRYGNDSLNKFLTTIAFILLIPFWITRWSVFSFPAPYEKSLLSQSLLHAYAAAG